MNGSFALGWRQVGSSFVMLSAIASIAAAYSVLAIPLAQEFRPSRTVLMLAMTVVSAVSAGIAPLLGTLMDRVSLRHLMVAGSLLLAGGYAALSFATSFTQVLIVFGVLIAPGNVLLGPVAATVLLSRWFAKRRGRAIGFALAGISMGSVVYPPLIQWLLDSFAWREAFRLLGLFLLLVTLPAALLVVNRPADKGLHPDGADADPVPAQAAGAAQPKVSARTIMTDPAFWLIAAVIAIVTSGMKGMVTNLAPIVIDEGIAASDAALLISLFGVCGFASKLAFAALADRVGARGLLIVTLGGFAGGMACLTQVEAGYAVIALGVGLTGLLGGFIVPLQSMLVPRIFGERVVGRAMGLLSMVLMVLGLFAPPLFGLGFDLTGSYAPVFLGFALAGALMIVAVPYLRLSPRRAERGEPAVVS